MKKVYIKKAYIKRRFDKINGNSYFNYYFINTKNNLINSKYSINYGYGDSYGLISQIKESFEKINFSKDFEIIDLGYGLKKNMINL